MAETKPSIINIAFVGGGTDCLELLEKSSIDYRQGVVNSRIIVIADTDPEAPALKMAEKMGIATVNDFHDIYKSEYDIHFIFILTPADGILEEILTTKPGHIRVLSYEAFTLFKELIGIEETKLKKRNEEIETILNGIQNFIVVINPDMEIVEVNDVFLEKMEYKHDEVIGQKCYKIFYDRDQPCVSTDTFKCALNEVIRNKMPFQQTIIRDKPRGNPRYVELSTFPVWEKSGKISKFVEISRDVTQRKQEEEGITRRLEKMVDERTKELENTHEQLLHQDKMASLGKLSATVVHEINNPITGILNLNLLMKRIIEEGDVGEKDLEQFSQYLELMETETRRISGIISNLLTFSRQSKIELKRISVNMLLEKTLLLNSNLFKLNNVDVIRKFYTQIPSIVGSGDQLQQVFMNFISNAVEAMEPKQGGTLLVETDYSKEDQKVIVRIKDTGVGMPRENLTRLFEPFFTTKTDGKGVGLGLSVAYGIIKEHGGTIYVNSKKEKGTTFKIKLPLEFSKKSNGWQGGINGER